MLTDFSRMLTGWEEIEQKMSSARSLLLPSPIIETLRVEFPLTRELKLTTGEFRANIPTT